MEMIKNLNPWDFSNNDKRLSSPDNLYTIVYSYLEEISMGAPLRGQCHLETIHQKIKIHDGCGGPPIWETGGELLAVPIWIISDLKGVSQQIGVVDTKTKELKIFSKIFRVLDLRSFENKIILGYDSPLYETERVIFDTQKEKIEKIIQLL